MAGDANVRWGVWTGMAPRKRHSEATSVGWLGSQRTRQDSIPRAPTTEPRSWRGGTSVQDGGSRPVVHGPPASSAKRKLAHNVGVATADGRSLTGSGKRRPHDRRSCEPLSYRGFFERGPSWGWLVGAILRERHDDVPLL